VLALKLAPNGARQVLRKLDGAWAPFLDFGPDQSSHFPWKTAKIAIMPRGSAPGERRGGRPKGGLAELGPNALDTITPANFQLVAMRALARVGQYAAALSVADKVAPYFNAKLAPLIVEPPAEPEEAKAKRLYDAMRQMRGTIDDSNGKS
jgi:hypothetical protein